MTTNKYISLTNRAETLCNEYVECVQTIEEYTSGMLSGHIDPEEVVRVITAARQRRNNLYAQLALLESIAIDILSYREFARYVRYVNVMLSPMTA